jgi:curved DNA-binding protein CbpA
MTRQEIEKQMDKLAREYHENKRPGNPGRDF